MSPYGIKKPDVESFNTLILSETNSSR